MKQRDGGKCVIHQPRRTGRQQFARRRDILSGSSTAGSATIANQGGGVAGAGQGFVTFQGTASGGTSHFINQGTATIDSRGLQNGGSVGFSEQSNAGAAVIENFGGTANGGSGGGVAFYGNAGAGGADVDQLSRHGFRRFGSASAFSTTRPPENAEIENRNGNVARGAGGLHAV